jgi:hypothetical protein
MLDGSARVQGGEQRRHTEAGIGPHESHSMPRRQHGQRLGKKLSDTIRRPRMPGPAKVGHKSRRCSLSLATNG